LTTKRKFWMLSTLATGKDFKHYRTNWKTRGPEFRLVNTDNVS
jgi:hypothetical protein